MGKIPRSKINAALGNTINYLHSDAHYKCKLMFTGIGALMRSTHL